MGAGLIKGDLTTHQHHCPIWSCVIGLVLWIQDPAIVFRQAIKGCVCVCVLLLLTRNDVTAFTVGSSGVQQHNLYR